MAKTRKQLIQDARLRMSNEERTVLALEQIADAIPDVMHELKGIKMGIIHPVDR